jgi:subfamily B ATP-binding cassette protein MsbA
MIYGFTRRIKRASRQVKKKQSDLASVAQEAISSARVVKALPARGSKRSGSTRSPRRSST